MPSQSAIIFKILLNRFNPGAGPATLKCLPKEEAKEILAQTTSSTDINSALFWARNIISRTHYSWLAPVVKTLPHVLQPSTVASLPKHQSEKLQSYLKLTPPKNTLPTSIQSFLLEKLYHHWQPKDAIPIEFIPPSKLKDLLKLSKNDLVNFIDFLALHDVADAIRHIVDKKYLRNIYECLTPQQQQYLRLCLQNKEKLTAPKLDIEKWDGNAESFHNILHKRGMLRLGKALCGQTALFLWHLIHILDTGRGNTLLQHYQTSEIPHITPLLVQQVLSLINFLKPSGK